MPVTTRIITDDSGSSRSVRLTEKSPEVIQVNTVCVIARSSGGMPARRATAATDTANDRMIAPQATAPAAPLLMRRPKLELTRKPASGKRAISSSMRSPLQAREGVGGQRLAMTEHADEDREADRGFGGGDGHDEEHDDLPVGGAERPAERDEAQVHRVQHDLDRQKDRDEVAADEHAGRADGEQNRREHEVVVQCRHHGVGGAGAPPRRVSLFARTTAPTIATMIRSEVTSNGNA